MDYPVDGFVADGFEAVRDVFVANFTDDIEVGASCCAVVDGEVVVDLWGGFQDRDATRPWERDTLVNVYSTTKGMGSAAVATLVDEGTLDYDAPVRDYWPEFRAGQGGLTVGQFLSHQSGICGVRERISVEDLYDWNGMVERALGARHGRRLSRDPVGVPRRRARVAGFGKDARHALSRAHRRSARG